MPEPSFTPKKLQWKWVGLTLLMYVVLYPAPMLIALYLLSTKAASVFIGAWLFAGIIIIAAIAAYRSEGVTLFEPAIASASFIVLFMIAILTIIRPAKLTLWQSIVEMVFTALFFFVMSLLGAWLGERAQKLWRKKLPETT